MKYSDAMMSSRSARRKKKGGSGIKLDPSKKGSLHTALGVPQGKPIPDAMIQSRLANASGNLKKKLVFAKNAKSFKH